MDDQDSSDYEYSDELVVIDFTKIKTLSDINPLDGLALSGIDTDHPKLHIGNTVYHPLKVKLPGHEIVYGKSTTSDEVIPIGTIDYHLIVSDPQTLRNRGISETVSVSMSNTEYGSISPHQSSSIDLSSQQQPQQGISTQTRTQSQVQGQGQVQTRTSKRRSVSTLASTSTPPFSSSSSSSSRRSTGGGIGGRGHRANPPRTKEEG